MQVRCGVAVTSVEVSGGRAAGVRLADGTALRARHGVLADVPAPALYGGLVAREHLPARLLHDVERFEWDNATLKLNWALDSPIPWVAAVRGAPAPSTSGSTTTASSTWRRTCPSGGCRPDPFLLLGQMTTADPTRSPEGTESAWAYTHLPLRWPTTDGGRGASRSSGWRSRSSRWPPASSARCGGGTCSPRGPSRTPTRACTAARSTRGTAALHQQLVLRPTRGLGRPETPLPGLFLAGASAHPGGGVHGACGWNAALAAIRQRRPPVRSGGPWSARRGTGCSGTPEALAVAALGEQARRRSASRLRGRS